MLVFPVAHTRTHPQEKKNTMEYMLFFFFFLCLLVYVMVMLFILPFLQSQDQNQTTDADAKKENSNTRSMPLLVIIGLEKNEEQFIKPLQQLWFDHTYNQAIWFHAIDKSTLTYQNQLTEYPLTERFRTFLWKRHQDVLDGKCTTDYLGHLACTMSHVEVIRRYVNLGTENEDYSNVLIVEDDVQMTPEFFTQFPLVEEALNQKDPDWDILCLGFACGYNNDKRCMLNDAGPIYEPGFVSLKFWFGGWAYVIHHTSKNKILSGFEPLINAQNDITMAEMAANGQLRVYGCIPTLMNHPGQLRISSFDFTQDGDMSQYRSDTNA